MFMGSPVYFTDKMPANWRFVPLIHLILPNARIIDVRRDPLPCCFSAFSTYFNRSSSFLRSPQDALCSWVTYNNASYGAVYRGMGSEGAMMAGSADRYGQRYDSVSSAAGSGSRPGRLKHGDSDRHAAPEAFPPATGSAITGSFARLAIEMGHHRGTRTLLPLAWAPSAIREPRCRQKIATQPTRPSA